MQIFRRILAISLMTAVTSLVATPDTNAQLMNDAWFKLKVSSKGYTYDATADKLVKDSLKLVAYMHLTWDGDSYDADVWCETAPGVWAKYNSANDLGSLLGPAEDIVTDEQMFFRDAQGRTMSGYVTAHFSRKLNSLGNLASATFRTLGGECIDGSLDLANEHRGDLAIRGRTIAVDKLPFVP